MGNALGRVGIDSIRFMVGTSLVFYRWVLTLFIGIMYFIPLRKRLSAMRDEVDRFLEQMYPG